MVRSRLISCVGFSLALVLALPLAAQDGKGQGRPRGGFGGRGGGDMSDSKLSLLHLEPVQAELKITPEQKDKISEAQKALSAEIGSGGAQGLSREDRQKRSAELREKREKLTAEADKKLETILKPEQVKRLDEIALQQRGPQGLKEESVQKALKLSDDQVQKINAALTWGQDERRKAFQDLRQQGGAGAGSDAAGGIREKQEKIQKEVETKVLAVLTDAQKEQFEKLKGSPFKLDRAALRPGGAGGKRGRNKAADGDDKKSDEKKSI
jgi:hypothetical protein